VIATSASAPARTGQRFNYNAAVLSLRTTGQRFPSCRTQSDPWGTGAATIFFANDGSVSKVLVGPPFTHTTTGDCVTSKLQEAQAPPFDGPQGVVIYHYFIPP
jgi:hypothetical protein